MLHVLEQKCKVEKVGEGMLKMWFNAIFFFLKEQVNTVVFLLYCI